MHCKAPAAAFAPDNFINLFLLLENAAVVLSTHSRRGTGKYNAERPDFAREAESIHQREFL